jgi:hypothetical protein
MADEAKAESAKLKADSEKSIADAKAEYAAALKAAHSNHASALESLKGEHTTALEALRAELTGKVSEAEGKATEALTAAQQRALQADLRVAAIRAGMIDLDGLKLLDMSKVELDDNGDLKNGDEIMAGLKEAKDFLFSKEPPPPPKSDTSSNTNDKKPDPKPAVGKKATEMTEAEFQQSWSHIMTTGKIPA